MSGSLPGDSVAIGEAGTRASADANPSMSSNINSDHKRARDATRNIPQRGNTASSITSTFSSASAPVASPHPLPMPMPGRPEVLLFSSSASDDPSASSSATSALPPIRADSLATPRQPLPPSFSSHLSPSSPSSASHAPLSAKAMHAVLAAHPQLLTPLERWAVQGSELRFNALAGAIGGFAAGVFTCPLDVIKTKLQAQGGFATGGAAGGQNHKRLYKGLVGTGRVIWQDEGVRGLYRGLGPIIMGYLPTWAVWFTVYNKSKSWMGERYQNTFVINFWSSVIAGASSTIVTNPIWVIKTRLMSQMPSHSRTGYDAYPRGVSTPTSRPTLQTPWHYHSTLDAARKMYTTEGILSFYSGLSPALLGLTHVAVQFPAYEYLKTKFTGHGMGEMAESAADGSEVAPPAHWIGILAATILSKALASSLTYPHEVIRTRLQTQRRAPSMRLSSAAVAAAGASSSPSASTVPPPPLLGDVTGPRYRGVIRTFRTILREEGWHAFYAGLGTNMMRAVPAATVTMLTYEYVMRALQQTRHDAHHKLAMAL